MSANNFIRIEKKDGKYIVTERDADTLRIGYVVGEYDTLSRANTAAKKEASGENNELGIPAEYGVEIDDSCFEEEKI